MSDKKETNHRFNFIFEEHADLRHEVGVIHGALSARLGRPAEVCDMLDAQVATLRSHFAEEEASDLFDEISAQTPRLAERASHLRAEHASLLQRALHVAERARSLQHVEGWWERIEEMYHRFCKELMHHETAENKLLQESYLDDIGAED